MGLVAEAVRELGRVVEPEEADVGLRGRLVSADFEDAGHAEGRGIEVVSGGDDGVVVKVGLE